ncbi:MAG: hypothetical protein L6R40_006713 [Gallowayella cf. fulva]|nr:MAG: hypothetical protein L6R40_006713 [Xanthomendoza cf. fulva]
MPESSGHQRKLATVHGLLGGNTILEPMVIDSNDSGEQIFQNIRQNQRKLLRRESRLWFLALLVTKGEIATAEIIWSVRHSDVAVTHSKQVVLGNCGRHDLFSKAIRNPQLLANEIGVNLIMEHGNLLLKDDDTIPGYEGQQVLVISMVVDKEKVAWLLLLSPILSPSLGLIVGQFTHRAEVGIAVGALVFACATFLQGLATWLHG